jgi:hypothetical protein
MLPWRRHIRCNGHVPLKCNMLLLRGDAHWPAAPIRCDDNTYTIQFVQSMAGFAGAGGESSVAMDTDGAGFGMEE